MLNTLFSNKSLRTLLSLNIFFIFGSALLGPLYAVFVKEIGGDILTIGWSFAAYMFAIGIFSYFTGRLADKMKEKEYLLGLGYLLRAVGFFGYILVQTPFHLFFIQLILGLAEALGNPSFKGIFSLHLDKGKHCSEWGIWDALYSIVVGISVMIGALIVSVCGFTYLFFVMGSISLLCFIILMLLPRPLL